MNVILQGDGSPFGVLEVDSKSEGEFGEHDIAFLQENKDFHNCRDQISH
jgi:putative methionine-R-sulfoxide reductase with GAF domain